jgi:hypothetical protein
MHLLHSEPPVSPGPAPAAPDANREPAPLRDLGGRHSQRVLEPIVLDPNESKPAENGSQLAEQRRVVIRLTVGEPILIGTAENRDRAVELARATIHRLEAEDGEWPFIGDRFIRPDSIVSVDVMRLT